MGYEVKPIETVYNGYRFRSRTEARWAVAFDAYLGKVYAHGYSKPRSWDYEREGFETPAGRYLPDFVWVENVSNEAPWCRGRYRDGVHTLNHFIEIKPGSPSEVEVAKLGHLALSEQYKAPDDYISHYILWGPLDDPSVTEVQPAEWVEGSPTHYEALPPFKLLDPWRADSWPPLLDLPGWWDDSEDRAVRERKVDYMRKALLVAKQARFEFGETPNYGRKQA